MPRYVTPELQDLIEKVKSNNNYPTFARAQKEVAQHAKVGMEIERISQRFPFIRKKRR